MVPQRLVLALLLVGCACLCSGADISRMLEELLSASDDASSVQKHRPFPPQRPRMPPPRPPVPPPRPPMPPPDQCYDRDGKTYKVGQRWLNDKCTARCRCRRRGIICVPVCPPTWAECGPNQIESTEKIPADRQGKCFCRVPVCLDKNDIESMLVK